MRDGPLVLSFIVFKKWPIFGKDRWKMNGVDFDVKIFSATASTTSVVEERSNSVRCVINEERLLKL